MPRAQLVLNMHRYQVEQSLGEGAFGQVRQAVLKETGEKVAIKTLKEKCKDLHAMMRMPEVVALRCIFHENIVKCKEFLLDKNGYVHIVFELLSGNLEMLARKRKEPFSEAQIRSIFYQLLCATRHMHSMKYMHRDIKPENILTESMSTTTGDIKLKLADLGLAKMCEPTNQRPNTTYVATRWYRSPEILLRITSYSFPSDMWAIGAVMAEIISLGEPLFPGRDERDQLARVMALRGHPAMVGWKKGEAAMRKRRIQLPKTTPSSLRSQIPLASLPVLQLISDLLEMDPDRRPSASEALQYPLFITHHDDDCNGLDRGIKRRAESPLRDAAQTRDLPSSRWSYGTEDLFNDNYRDIDSYFVKAGNSTSSPPLRPGHQTYRLPPSPLVTTPHRYGNTGSIGQIFDIPTFPCDCDARSCDRHQVTKRRRAGDLFDLFNLGSE